MADRDDRIQAQAGGIDAENWLLRTLAQFQERPYNSARMRTPT
jgi:hypothetical protein